jgi:hypothetical protein
VKKTGTTLEIPREVVAISSLRAHPENYRDHPDDQLDHIAQSLREHGQYRNVVVARDGTILAGHGVVQAAEKIGWTEVVVVRLDLDPADPVAVKLLVGDNEMGRLADVDDRLLSAHLKEVLEADSLLGTGFDEQMLANLVFVTRPMSEIRTIDEAAQWVGLPEFSSAGDDILLVLHFDDEEGRDKLIADLGVTVAKKMRQTWSGWYPAREKNDLASLRFEGA